MAEFYLADVNTFSGEHAPLSVFNPGDITVTEAPGSLRLQYTGGGLWEGGDAPSVYEAVADCNGLPRKWSTRIDSLTTGAGYYDARSGLILWGANLGADYAEYLAIVLMRYASGGKRRIQVQMRGFNIYDSYDWVDADLPIGLQIEEAVRFDEGAGIFRYITRWKKNVVDRETMLDANGWIELFDTGDRPETHMGRSWGSKYIGTVNWYFAPADVYYSEWATQAYDSSPPVLTDESPEDGSTEVSLRPAFHFRAVDTDSGINDLATSVTIAGRLAYSGGAAQDGFTVTKAAISGGYEYTIACVTAFAPLASIIWSVHCEDNAGNEADALFTFETAMAYAVKTRIAALYVDDLRYEDLSGSIAVINTMPADDESNVKADWPVQLQIVSLVNTALDPSAKVYFFSTLNGTRALVYDQAAGGFQTGYSGTATVRKSPGSGVDDELVLSIQPAVAFDSLDCIVVEVEAKLSGWTVPWSTSYDFTVEDLTSAALEEIFWLTPKRARVKFNETVSQSTAPGGAQFVKHFQSSVTVTDSSHVHVAGAELDSSHVGYYFHLAGSATPTNNVARLVTAVNATACELTLSPADLVSDDGADLDEAGAVVNRRTIRGTLSAYKLEHRPELEGLDYPSNSAERIQVGYAPLITAASPVLTSELPVGEDPDRYVYLDFRQPISIGRKYRLSFLGIEDAAGNTPATAATLDFTAPIFGYPSGRIGYWHRVCLPMTDQQDDLEAGGYLRRMAVTLQDGMNVLWMGTDQVQYLNDPYRCPEEWLEHLLYNLGNPFKFPLETVHIKRRLAAALQAFYKGIGGERAIEDMLYLLLGYRMTIRAFIEADAWILGTSKLGYDTALAPGTTWARNCYEIDTNGVTLTDAERRIVRDVATWADPVDMHLIRIVEPGTDPSYESNYWVLGYSALGHNTKLR